MANRTYLIQSDLPGLADCKSGEDVLVAASYSIPIFWYALFDQRSITVKMAQMEDGTAIP